MAYSLNLPQVKFMIRKAIYIVNKRKVDCVPREIYDAGHKNRGEETDPRRFTISDV